ncbi:MAG: hypothetical protein HQ530_02935 [Parcubacteria group bacterium]|nr:hypothetical protein [Parcubacteria group bacterium]
MTKKLIKWLTVFSLVLVVGLVSSYVYLYFWGPREIISIFQDEEIPTEIKDYNNRMYDKEKVTVNKRNAITAAQELLKSGDNIKRLDELSPLQDTKSYLEVCHYNPDKKQYFLLLDEPGGELEKNFTTRLCHRVMFIFEQPEDFTEVIVGAEDGQVASWIQGGDQPRELEYFQTKPVGDFVLKQEIDVDHDGNEEAYVIAHPAKPNEQGLIPVYYLSYSYVTEASSWIWTYNFLRAVDPGVKDGIKGMAKIGSIDDITDDRVDEILVTFKSEGENGRLLALLDSSHYLWTNLLYYGDLPGGAVKVKDGELITTESAWTENDAQCCPSGRLETSYRFDGQRMIKEIK